MKTAKDGTEKEEWIPAIGILTPSTGICRMEYAQSLARLVMHCAAFRIFEDCPRQLIRVESIIGSGIAANYQEMVRQLLADKQVYWTHFLSIEDDMIFAPDCLHILARRNVDIVGANYSVNKGKPLRFTAIGLDGKPCITRADSTGIEEVSLLPQGFTLVSRQVYERLDLPWYIEGYSPSSGRFVAQDYYFCEKAREKGFKVFVDHDVSKRVAHIGPHVYTFKDALRYYRKKEKAKDDKSERSLCVGRGRRPAKPGRRRAAEKGRRHLARRAAVEAL